MLKKSFALVTSVVMLLLLFNCSNPGDEPLRWSSATEIPITNEKFIMIDEFDDMFDYKDTMKIVDPDTTKIGDTLEFLKLATDTFTVEQNEDKIDTQTFIAVLGNVSLSNTTPIADTLALSAVAGNFSGTLPLTIDKVYDVTFYDTAANLMAVKVDNISSVAMSNVSIGIAGVDTQTIASLAANTSATVNLDVGGKRLLQNIQFLVSGTAATDGAKQLGLTSSLNGLIVSNCKVDDHLVSINQVVIAPYDITDTVAMDYIDISEGFFNYEVQNYTDLGFQVGLEHKHMWTTSFCEGQSITNISGLKSTTAADSLGQYKGDKILMSGTSILPKSDKLIAAPNISANRLFTLWDTVRQESYTDIYYSLNSNTPTGDTVTLNANDSIKFKIYVTSFKFKEFLGTVMIPYVKSGDTQKVSITLPEPLDTTMMDSLRGNVVLTDVKGIVNLKTEMPSRAYIDTMQVEFVSIAQNAMQIRDTTITNFTNVTRDSVFKRTVGITNVTNQFPDTVVITTRVRIPVGTRMRVCNNLTTENSLDYSRYIGQMTISVATNYELRPKIDWTVLDTTYLDLGSSEFEVIEALRYIRKLESRKVTMSLKIRNNSNMHMRIFSLIAPRSKMKELDSIHTNEFVQLALLPDSAEKRGFVNFLGSTGVYLPSRTVTTPVTSEVVLNNNQLETILESDSCTWRWLARLEVQDRDALTDTDYVDIRSKMRIEGINRSDSLMIW